MPHSAGAGAPGAACALPPNRAEQPGTTRGRGQSKVCGGGGRAELPFTASPFAACGSGTLSRWSCQGGECELRALLRGGQGRPARCPQARPARHRRGAAGSAARHGRAPRSRPPSPAHTRHAHTLPLGIGTPHTHTRSQPGPRQLCGTQERGVSLQQKSWVCCFFFFFFF